MSDCDARRETLKHIAEVKGRLQLVAAEFLRRGECHDASKLESPEWEMFAGATAKLRGLEFGSPEYEESLKGLGPALSHHYKNNSHHPQFYESGIRGMNLFDVLEMLMDWEAAALRHATGDVRKSIEINQTRFDYSDDFKRLLHNTMDYLDEMRS